MITRRIFKSTVLVMLAFMLIRLLGLVREVTLATVYGAGTVSDAFVIAFTLPNTLLNIISVAASAAFIPAYMRAQEKGLLFTNNIVNLLSIIGLIFSLIFSLFPEALVYLFASQLDAETFRVAATLLRVIIWSATPMLLSNIFNSYLQAHDAFFSGTVAGGLVNLLVVPAIIISGQTGYLPLIAIAVTAGNIASMLVLALIGGRYGYEYRLYVDLRDNNLKAMLLAIAPVIISLGITEMNQIVDRNFASSLPSGAISSLNYAAKLSGIMTTLIGGAFVTVLFPKMSEMAIDGDTQSLKQYLVFSIKRLAPVLLPLSAGAIALAEPIVRLLFERGSFTPEDTIRTAQCLQMYAIAFLVNNINPFLARTYYAMGNTKTPAICSAVAVAVNIVLNFILIAPLQHQGLALSTAVSGFVITALLILSLRKRLGPLGLMSEIKELLKITIASVLTGTAAYYVNSALSSSASGETVKDALQTVGLVAVSAILYFGFLAVFRSTNLRDAMSQIKRHIKKDEHK